MDDKDINDIRTIHDFRNISFSEFQKSKVKLELIKSIINNKIEPSCYWSTELIAAGHFIDLWDVILIVCSKHIHVGNPKLPIYIELRYENFKDILINGYIDNEIKLRNNKRIRRLFAELICILCLSPKRHSVQEIKIDPEEFDIALLSDKLKADKITYCENIFKKDDPKQLFIPLNELAFNLKKKNNISSTYWIEWLLQFESLCRQKKINLVCETRQNMPVKFEFQKDSVWLIWETLLAELDDRKDDKKILKRIINSLLNLYCIKFSHSAKKKRKSIIYFAVSLLTDFVDFNIEIFSQSSFIENVVKKIDTIYKELKKNEKSPETDYLFTNVKKDNFDKSISKIEMMNNLEDFDKE